MIVGSFFGFSGGGGGTPTPPTSLCWALNGNTVGSEKYFGTNDNYSIPIYTNGSAIGVFLNTGDFGFGTIAPTSRVHVKGIDATSSNYALKIDNSSASPLLYVRNDAKVSIGKATTLTTLDILGDTTNTLFKLNNANFAFADKLRIDNNGSFYSGSINAFGGFGTGTYTTDHLNYTLNTSFSTYLAFTNAGGAGNKTSYGIIGGAIGSADSDYRLVILNSDTSTVSGSGLKVLSTGASIGNDGFDYYNYGVNINSSGTFTNSGSGTNYKIGLNVNVSNGEVNYAALLNGGNVGIGTLSPSKTLTVISQGTNKMILGIGLNILSSPYDIVNTYSTGNGKIIYRDQSNITGYTDGLLHVDYLDATTLSLHSRWYDGTNGVENIRIAGKGTSWFNGGDVAIGTNSASAQLHIKGIDATAGNYALKVDNSASSPLLYVTNNGLVSINQTTVGAARLEITGGAFQGIYVQTTASIGINAVETSGLAVKGEVSTGTALRGNLTNAAGIGLDVNYTPTNTTIIKAIGTGEVGIGIFTPVVRFHVFGLNNGVNQRLEPVGSVTEDTTGNTVNTTDATANVTAQTIAVPTDNVISLESTIVYRKTGGAGVGTTGDGTTIKLNSSVKNVGGTLTLDTVQNTYTGTTNAIVGASATYTISGTNVLISVTGVLNDNITWNVITKVNTVA
jgi:hypothetical protein